jgi:hypothetical protein
MNFSTGDIQREISGYEWRTEACSTPLFIKRGRADGCVPKLRLWMDAREQLPRRGHPEVLTKNKPALRTRA